jgi:hypothetical protein
VNDDERGDQGHVSAAYCVSLTRDTMLWTHTVFTLVLFFFWHYSYLRWMAKLSNVLVSGLVWNLINLLLKPLEYLMRLSRTFFKPDGGFWIAFTFRGRMIHELADTVGISYGVCQEILTENLNVCHNVTKFVPSILDKWSRAAVRKRVLSFKIRLIGPDFYV